MSLQIVKFLSPPLALISAAFLMHVGRRGVASGFRRADAQQQARELLAGRIATRVGTTRAAC